MIGRFIQTLKYMRSKMKIINVHKQSEIDKKIAEIEELKDKCKHLEDAVDYINSLNQSQQGENSSRYNKKRGQQPEESVN